MSKFDDSLFEDEQYDGPEEGELFEDTEYSLDEVMSGEAGAKEMAKQTSGSEAFLKGAQEGLTLGFSDELGGVVQAGLDEAQQLANLTGLTDQKSPTQIAQELKEQGFDTGQPTNTFEMYKAARDERRAEQAKAMEDQPLASIAGNIGGALLTGGAGSAKLVGKGSQELAKRLPKMITEKTPGWLKSLMKTGATGAAAGGVYGPGMSEGETPEEILSDTGEMAQLGLLTGVAGQALGGAAKGAGQGMSNLVKNIPTLQKASDAFKRGLKGEVLTGSAQEAVKQEISDVADDIVNQINRRTKAVGRVIKRASEQQDLRSTKGLANLQRQVQEAKQDPTLTRQAIKELDELNNYLDDVLKGREQEYLGAVSKPAKLPDQLEQEAEKKLTEKAAKKLATSERPDAQMSPIDDVVEEGIPLKSSTVDGQRMAEVVKEPQDELMTKLKRYKAREGGLGDDASVEDLTKVKRNLQALTEVGDDAFKFRESKDLALQGVREIQEILQDVPGLQKAEKAYSGLMKSKGALGVDSRTRPEEFGDVLTKFIDNTFSGKIQADQLRKLNRFLTSLEAENPKLYARIEPKLKDIADKVGIVDLTAGEGFTILGSIPGRLVSGANLAGRGARSAVEKGIGSTPEQISQGIQKVRSMPNAVAKSFNKLVDNSESLQGLTNYVVRKYGETAQPIANVLQKLQTAPEAKKSALMYGLMQNPAYRKMIEDYVNDLDTEE